MKSRDFAFWLQGFFELHGEPVGGLTGHQTAVIKQHLGLVFQHDPDIAAKPHSPLPASPGQPRQIFPYPGSSGDVPQQPPLMIC